MKKQHRAFQVLIPPDNARYQLGYLAVNEACPRVGLYSGFPDIPATDPAHGAMVVGPYLFNLDTRKIVGFKPLSLDASTFKQSEEPVIGDENTCFHSYATGSIVFTDRSSYEPKEYEYSLSSWNEALGKSALETSKVTLLTDSKTDDGFVTLFETGSSELASYSRQCHLCTSGEWLKYDSEDNLVGVDRFGGPRLLHVEWGLDFTNMMSFELQNPSLEGVDFSTGYVEMVFDVQVEWGCTETSGEYSQYCIGVPIMTSPAFRLPSGVSPEAYFEPMRQAVQADARALSKVGNSYYFFDSVVEAVRGLDVESINGIAFALDLLKLGELVRPLRRALKNPWVISNWSAVILSYHYGTRLTCKDAQVVVNSLRRLRKIAKTMEKYTKFLNSLRSSYGTLKSDHSFKGHPVKSCAQARFVGRRRIPIQSNLDGIAEMVRQIGVDPLSRVNWWDLIPYSFVVDWVVSISGLLEDIDSSAKIDSYDLREIVYSRRNECALSCGEYGLRHFSGSLTLRSYDRRVSLKFPPMPLRLDFPLSFLRHWWEAALLILNGRGNH